MSEQDKEEPGDQSNVSAGGKYQLQWGGQLGQPEPCGHGTKFTYYPKSNKELRDRDVPSTNLSKGGFTQTGTTHLVLLLTTFYGSTICEQAPSAFWIDMWCLSLFQNTPLVPEVRSNSGESFWP